MVYIISVIVKYYSTHIRILYYIVSCVDMGKARKHCYHLTTLKQYFKSASTEIRICYFSIYEFIC
jgi:hypothetical protein